MEGWLSVLVFASLANLVLSGPIETCSEQATCLQVTYGNCVGTKRQVCLSWSNRDGCIKGSGTVSHVCPVNGLSAGPATQNWGSGVPLCIDGESADSVEFVVKDGNAQTAATGNYDLPSNIITIKAFCQGLRAYCEGSKTEVKWTIPVLACPPTTTTTSTTTTTTATTTSTTTATTTTTRPTTPTPPPPYVSHWSQWSDCTKPTCESAGTRTRTRVCYSTPSYCSTITTVETEVCYNKLNCPKKDPHPSFLSPWSKWGPCLAPCGAKGVQYRHRLCQGAFCEVVKHLLTEAHFCVAPPCIGKGPEPYGPKKGGKVIKGHLRNQRNRKGKRRGKLVNRKGSKSKGRKPYV